MVKINLKNNENGKLIIYTGSKGVVELMADKNMETVWATQAQIAELFDVQKAAVSKHFRNIFVSGELNRKSTVSKMETVQNENGRSVTRQIEFYNLDVVIAVGYRVNSKKATQFRIWATNTLREYLVKGIVVNNDRINKLPDRILADLDEKISFIQRTIKKRELNQSETDSLLSVIHDYANSWKFLKEYDEGELRLKKGKSKEQKHFDYEFVRNAIDILKNDNTLVALALLIAESNPKDKELMVALTTNLLA